MFRDSKTTAAPLAAALALVLGAYSVQAQSQSQDRRSRIDAAKECSDRRCRLESSTVRGMIGSSPCP